MSWVCRLHRGCSDIGELFKVSPWRIGSNEGKTYRYLLNHFFSINVFYSWVSKSSHVHVELFCGPLFIVLAEFLKHFIFISSLTVLKPQQRTTVVLSTNLFWSDPIFSRYLCLLILCMFLEIQSLVVQSEKGARFTVIGILLAGQNQVSTHFVLSFC